MKVFFTIMLTAVMAAFALANTGAGAFRNSDHTNKETAKDFRSLMAGEASELQVWCSNAVPIQCGDFLAYETTAGGANNILTYPGCGPASYSGPEKVYVINKTTLGDLQVGIQIITPGIDLDIFILADNCNQLTCLAASTSNNTQSNYEGVVLPNAPIGTYYVVVDGKTPADQGQYRLETGCAGLNCNDAIPLNCGTPFEHTNQNGHDNVALYGCNGSNLVGGNNGPEVVHTFTITQAGWVNVSLTNLQANLELFLLPSCQRDACLFYSTNPGTANEHIAAFLQPGTYYVVVDGNNGAVSNYTLLVDCPTSCNLSIVNSSSTPAGCGLANGAISLSVAGGAPSYAVQYTGPTSGSFNSASGSIQITGLLAGQYQLRVTEAGGCFVTRTVTVFSNSNLSATTNTNPDLCGAGGDVRFNMSNGTAPYSIQLSGPVSGTYNTGITQSYPVGNLTPGTYTARIQDAQGCVVLSTFVIEYSSGIFSFNGTAVAAGCQAPGSISIQAVNGIAPYNVTVTGPVSRAFSTNTSQFAIPGLPAGTYNVSVRSANNCIFSRAITVHRTGLQVLANAYNGACNQPGSIALQFIGGTAPFNIAWGGPTPGQVIITGTSYTITGLSSGAYPVQVIDATGCTDYRVMQINNSAAPLAATFSAGGGACSATGFIAVQIGNGVPQFTIIWAGPVMGSTVVSNYNHVIPNLPGGAYMVQVIDSGGCSRSGMVTVTTGTPLQVAATAQPAGCGATGGISLAMSNGPAPYQISWAGPVSGSATSNSANYSIANLPGGIYSITVGSANGCQSIQTVTVTTTDSGNFTVVLMPLEASCQLCAAIWVDIYGGTAPYTITWTGPSSGSLVTTLTNLDIYCVNAGTYTVVVTDANGCTTQATITINQGPNALHITATPTDADCLGGPTGQVLLDISNGTPGYLVQWVGPVVGTYFSPVGYFSIYNLPPGNYNFTITDAEGCFLTVPVQIGTGFNLVVSPVPGPCGQPGSLQLSYSGGLPPFNITWSGPSSGSASSANTTYSITNLPPGTYSVTVTSSDGCSASRQATLIHIPNVVCTALPVPDVCGNTGSIHVGISSGTPGFTVTWTGPVSGSATTQNFFYNINNLPSGNYVITVTDANGCVCTHTVHLQNGTGSPTVSLTPVNGICGAPGSIGVHITGGVGPFQIVWTGPLSGAANTPNNAYVISNLPGGTYTVTVTGSNNCSATATTTIQITGSPISLNVTPVPGLCGALGSLWVDILGGTPPYNLSWVGPVSGSTTLNVNGYNIPNLPSGSYTLTVTDAQGCTYTKVVTLVNNNAVPDFSATPQPGVCAQPGSIALQITGSPGPYMVTWTGPVSGMVNNVPASYTITNLPSGTYTIMVKDINNCTKTRTATLNNGTNLQITVVPVPNVCHQPGAINIGMTGGTAPYSITWAGPSSGSATTNNALFNINNLPSGTYTVSVTDATGCARTQTVVLDNSANNVSLNVTPTPGQCGANGSLLVAIIGGTAPYQLAWTGPVSGSTSLNVNGFSIPNLPSGTYTVTVTDAQSCTFSRTATLVNNTQVPDFTATPNPGICDQPGSIVLAITGSPGPYMITWTGPVPGMVNGAPANYTMTNLSSGTYTITVKDANNCTKTRTVSLNNSANNLQVTATAVPGLCDQPGQVNIAITGGTAPYTVVWSGPASGSATTNNLAYNIPGLASGAYTIVVTDVNGCARTRTATLTNIPNNLQITATAVPGVCGQNGAILVGITGGTAPYIVAWSGPASGSANTNNSSYTIPNLPSGTYTITVTDVNGCVRTLTRTLNNGPVITLAATGVNGICNQPGSIQLTIGGPPAPYNVAWTGPVSGGATAPGSNYTINNLPSGAYTITVSTDPTCTATQTVTLDNGQAFDMTVTANPGICVTTGSLAIVFSGATPPVAITWTGPATGAANTNNNTYNIPDLPSGAYTITATTADGCTATRTITLNNATSMLAVTATPVNGLCGEPGSVTLLITGGTGPYSIAWTGPASGSATTANTTYVVANLGAGVYTFTVTDANGCDNSTTATIEVFDTDIAVTATSVTGECGENGSIEVEITGGNPNYTISWSGPESGSITTANLVYTIANVPPGAYQISVTDAEGCAEAATTTLAPPSEALVISVSGQNGLCGENGSVTVTIITGEAPYTITWAGAANGTTTTLDAVFTIPNAPPGSYFFTVEDANGCDDSSIIAISTSGGVNATSVAMNGLCGLQGSIIVNIIGGTGPYTIEWSGAASGSATTAATTYTLPNLASGTYSFTITDAQGCVATTSEVLNNTGVPFSINAFPFNGLCGDLGYIRVNMIGGVGPFLITWTGPSSGSISTAAATYDILNLPSGLYMIEVTDAQGCSGMDMEMITNSDTGALVAAITGFNGTCGGLGAIRINIFQGQAPFLIMWSGPQSGMITTSSLEYNILNLPGGTYNVLVRDANLCERNFTMTIVNTPSTLDFSLTANNNVCGLLGSATVNITGTAPPYLITWTGLFSSGSTTISGNTFTIPDLQSGTYTVRVDDSEGCFEFRSIQVNNEEGVFVMTLVPNVGGCFSQSSIQINISGGQAPYLLNWDGPSSSGAVTFTTSTYNLFGLPPGPYMIMVTDLAGCWVMQTLVLEPGNSPPVAAFSVATNLLTASFTNNSSPGVYLWNFGDGTTSTAINPVHTYAEDGSYIVCLTVTNGCGTTLHCQSVTVTIPSSTVILDVGSGSGTAGNTILVPVRIRHCNLLLSLSGSLSVQNLSVANITQIFPAAIAPQFNAVNKTFSFSSGPGVPLVENQILFYLVVHLTGSPGQSSIINLVNTPVAIQVGGLLNGQPAILPHITYTGNVSISNFLMADTDEFAYPDFPDDDSGFNSEEEQSGMTQLNGAGGQAASGQSVEQTREYHLHQNAPNPFTGNTAISFDLPEAMNADLIITDQFGRVVRIVRGAYPQGRNTVEFDAGSLSRGVYRYTLKTSAFSATRTMILVR